MAQRNANGSIKQSNPRARVNIPLFRPQTYTIKPRDDGTVDIRVDRFNSFALTLNLQDERTCGELIKALEESMLIMKRKRKKGKIV